MPKIFLSSLTRISNLEHQDFSIQETPRASWQTGDYIVGEVVPTQGGLSTIELATGREVKVSTGDYVVGALGRRAATLEAVGDWHDIDEDLRFEALTAAGVFGRCTSRSTFMPPLLQLEYRGHVLVDNKGLKMVDCVDPLPKTSCSVPLILIIGTSMDAGKTLSAKVIIRLLKSRGLRVAGVKFTGVGRYRDIMAMSDAGADSIYDFTDAGLPSTCCPRSEYEGVVDHILTRIANDQIDVIVGEAGASPMEPYNGDVAVAELQKVVAYTVLCASDPYAVVGVIDAFGTKPNLIAGRATCTTAGLSLVEKLCGIRALDLMDPKAIPELEGSLRAAMPAVFSQLASE